MEAIRPGQHSNGCLYIDVAAGVRDGKARSRRVVRAHAGLVRRVGLYIHTSQRKPDEATHGTAPLRYFFFLLLLSLLLGMTRRLFVTANVPGTMLARTPA